MSDRPFLVVDNTVLSSLFAAGWFDALQFWADQYDITVTERVWKREFVPHHELSSPPEWLSVTSVDLDSIDSQLIGLLGEQDWSLVVLAMHNEHSRLLTNDRTMRREALERDVDVEWGTSFVLRTFEICGIDSETFDSGIEPYAADVRLPEDVVRELQNAEKDR